MAENLRADICVIGAGSAGLSVAAGASQMGAKTVLIERAEMGGDCLNYGCVPSKSLLAAAHAAQAMRESAVFGVNGAVPGIDFAKVHDHVHGVIAAIAPNASVERFEGLGVRVIQAHGRFTGPAEVAAGDCVIAARRFVVATGSSPAVPPIPELNTVPFLTNETLWDNRDLPETLIVIGGGPIGIELAQAHRRLGSRVIVLEALTALGREDPEIAAVALDRLRAEGVEIRDGARVAAVAGTAGAIEVTLEGGGTLTGSHLLVATGRRANVEGIGLEVAGIDFDRGGVTVDKGLRSVSNRRVYAIGDVAGPPMLAHKAEHEGVICIEKIAGLNDVHAMNMGQIPGCTYCHPQVASIGLSEAAAREAGREVKVGRFPFMGNGKAIALGDDQGLVKTIFDAGTGELLGAHMIGAEVTELIQGYAVAMQLETTETELMHTVFPHPTLSEMMHESVLDAYGRAIHF